MAIADTTRKAESTVGGGPTVVVTINSTVAGNLLVVGVSAYNSSSIDMTSPTCSDGANPWKLAFAVQASSGTERQAAILFYAITHTGGNRTITVTPASGTFDGSIYAHEFSGVHGVPLSGTPVTNTGTTQTTSDTTGFTPNDGNCLYIAVDGHSATGTVTENVSPGDTDWTLSNDHESGTSAEPGSMVFFIRSGSAVSRRSAWTIPSGTFWAAGIAAFKEALAIVPAHAPVRHPGKYV